jgi:uncharacterized membrane-anchored protein
MRAINVPTLGLRYWAAISLASVFGANTGDLVSNVLGLGHYKGLAPLAVVLAVILLLERRARVASEAYYWLAIVTVRTAATNLADLGTHDLRLGYPGTIAGLGVLLTVIVIAHRRRGAGAAPTGVPDTNALYWTGMLTAGTLGTAAGDFIAHDLGLGPASLVTSAVLAVVLALGGRSGLATPLAYWTTIVIVRTAGTNVGDFLAGRHGLGWGLPLSTALTGLLMLATLLLWKRRQVALAST